MDSKKNPGSTSSDYDRSKPYLDKVEAILCGEHAVKAAGKTYLPRFPDEVDSEYAFRLQVAKFTNIFGDIVGSLASKPFTREVKVETQDAELLTLADDIDGRGNSIHVFAHDWFYNGIASGIDWVWIDYTRSDRAPATKAEEASMGMRPYWVRIPALKVLAVYSVRVGGQEVISHARIDQSVTVQKDWGESTVRRVKVVNRAVEVNGRGEPIGLAPATWQLWEEETKGSISKWNLLEEGLLDIGEIPMVPLVLGRRDGWYVYPPMEAAADLQITHYQQDSDLEYTKKMAAYPTLVGEGVSPPKDPADATKSGRLVMGPKSALFAPRDTEGRHGTFRYIQPDPSLLKFLADEVRSSEQQLRELGRQPLTMKAGNITTVAAAYSGDKAKTVLEAWATSLADALEYCWYFTLLWMGRKDGEVEVDVDTDFSVDPLDDKNVTELSTARKNGDLSRNTYWEELQRRGILSPNFDPEEEANRLQEEMPADPVDDGSEDLNLA